MYYIVLKDSQGRLYEEDLTADFAARKVLRKHKPLYRKEYSQ
jgi:hypothetical protein